MNLQLKQLREQIQERYNGFYDKLGVDSLTGIWKNAPQGRELRFATMPHIGVNFHNAPLKILFVGYDMGMDENGTIQTFEDRSAGFVNMDLYNLKSPYNAGTYIATLMLFARYEVAYRDAWNYFAEIESPNDFAIRNAKKDVVLDPNLLSNVAQTNLHKFVTVNRELRTGAGDRSWFGQREEIECLLIDEIKILKPNVIFFQGSTINDSIWEKLLSICDWKMEKFHALHPSSPKANTPAYVKKLKGMEVK